MKKKSFAEMVEASKNEKFTLPHNIKSHKQLLPNGTWSYVFRHDNLGEFGRILIVPHGTQSRICCEVAGDPNDPLTEKRRVIFEPIGKKLADKMAFICGVGKGNPSAPYISPKENHLVKSTVYPCDVCKTVTAMLVFAGDADTQARLEDFARMMYPKIKEINVPTWIVGRETENIVNGKDLRKSLVLKVHPEREEAKITTPDDLMDIVDKLMETHCKKQNGEELVNG
jgi:hypothetical protein